MRLGKFLCLIGLTLVLSSLIGSGGYGTGAAVEHGEYEGEIFKAIGSVIVEAQEHRNLFFSLYVLTWDAFQGVLEDAIIRDNDTLTKIEGINAHLYTTIHLPGPGVYVFLVSSYLNESVNVDLTVYHSPPQTGLSIPGLGIAIVGFIMVMVSRYARMYRKRSSMTE